MSLKSTSTDVIGKTSADVIPKPQSEIFNLKMDHFEEIFDWLSLKDLVMLGETCKRMQRIVGYYVKTNYTAAKFEFRSDGIHASDTDAIAQIKLDGLSSFLRKLVFFYMRNMRNDYSEQGNPRKEIKIIPHMKASQFKSLTEILLTRVIFTDMGISLIKEIMSQIETVKLEFSNFVDENKEFYDDFLQFFTNIKKLCILGWKDVPIIGTDNSWLLRKYPTLEHFELTTQFCSGEEITELQTFFEQNPNIKMFATRANIILANKNIFNNTKLKLDILSVLFRYTDELNSTRDSLNKLYERGLFKQLHIYFFTHFRSTFNQEAANQLVSFNGLTKLFIEGMEDGTDLSALINLKHFCIDCPSYISNMETLAKHLVNLETIQFTYSSVQFAQEILPFIRYSRKLNTIVLFRTENYENILKIEELNEERSKLANARKVTIYVEEYVYLRAKWAKNRTSWSLIEIKRGTSYDTLNHNFEYMDY